MKRTAVLLASGVFLTALAGAAVSIPAHAQQEAAAPAEKSGRQGFLARQRACAAEWKADKAAGKIPAGMRWPKYLSECNKRKKAEGM
ncbi:MAG TPA: hypothetical protein VK430_03875 [Xanthobacteraceae bacterium]|nr:hypothetical protein [Xanthobacteraceae bacterium]